MGHREAEPRGCRLALHLVRGGSVPAAGGNRPLHLGTEGHLVSRAAGRGEARGTQEEASRPLTTSAQPAPSLTKDRPPNMEASLPASPTTSVSGPSSLRSATPTLWILSSAAARLLPPTAHRPPPAVRAQGLQHDSGPAQAQPGHEGPPHPPPSHTPAASPWDLGPGRAKRGPQVTQTQAGTPSPP